jgi:hypothetical protein
VPVYVTEHAMSRMTDAHLRSVRVALTETTRRLSLAGNPIHLLECSYVPQQRLICKFAATGETQVRQAVDLAQLPLPTVCRPADSDTELASGRLPTDGSELTAEAVGDSEPGR